MGQPLLLRTTAADTPASCPAGSSRKAGPWAHPACVIPGIRTADANACRSQTRARSHHLSFSPRPAQWNRFEVGVELQVGVWDAGGRRSGHSCVECARSRPVAPHACTALRRWGDRWPGVRPLMESYYRTLGDFKKNDFRPWVSGSQGFRFTAHVDGLKGFGRGRRVEGWRGGTTVQGGKKGGEECTVPLVATLQMVWAESTRVASGRGWGGGWRGR